MKFEVPQFVDVEDKIIGPLTWKQFVFLAGGVGAGLVIFFATPFWFFILVGVPFIIFGAGLAFYQVNNRPLAVLLEAMTSYFTKSRLYLWKREGVAQAPIAPAVPEHSASPAAPLVASVPEQPLRSIATGTAGNIASLSRKLEVRAIEGNILETRP